eukprot:CAMPEP_0180084386 /NCGR_PEP_ID=MMETSP0985-20121206/19828_1 /TAXON_ID=483367 /ORGANISM="non described non described, Strain CCMP 2436" /LENGTH=135 /DNA_ID=CAMNT_0022018033 /DNA_START=373 /DNA_END=782 /DNA_ORIENTATION=-
MATFMPSTCESPTGSLARAQPLQLCGLPAFGRASAHHLGEREADDDAHLSLRTDDSAEKTAVLEHKRGLVQLAAADDTASSSSGGSAITIIASSSAGSSSSRGARGRKRTTGAADGPAPAAGGSASPAGSCALGN